MNRFIFVSLLILLTFIVSPNKTKAETPLNVYMNDFYSKSNKASKILKEIETSLKDGSRKNVCSRQREAARLKLLANKSLIKAFEIAGTEPPMKAIKSNQKRWELILNEC
tara:strand:+ start:1103 stop:1432 length:330 start_codon:yes stop_codon:yes gene_type:complete